MYNIGIAQKKCYVYYALTLPCSENMLIHSGLITLDYNPATDVLVTSMPDIKEFSSSEVSFCLGLIVESVKNYHIGNLLLDSSKSVVEVEDEAYRALVLKFSMDLMGTRLKKLARVGTADARREEKAASLSAEVRQRANLPIEFKSFATEDEAMAWLLA